MQSKSPPTIQAIARASGRSSCTVSLALRDHPRISGKVKEKINRIAREMGWKPNPIVAACMSHIRSNNPPGYQANLAFLVSHPSSGAIEDLPLFQKRFYSGAKARAAELGYSLQPVWLHERGLTGTRLTGMLKSQGIPGLVIPSFIRPTEVLATFDWSYFAAATGGYTLVEPQLHRVFGHLIHGMHLLLRKVIERGYRRIAVVFSDKIDSRTDHGMLYPIYYEQQHQPDLEWIRHYNYTVPMSASARRELGRRIKREKPQVLIGEQAILNILKENQWTVPKNIAFVALDWSPTRPKISGLNQMHEVRGALTVDLVTAQLAQHERGIPAIPKLLLVEGQWEEGESCPDALL